ncbi:MAG: metalloregulator ArsR/SmtB family transcription factor [Myxococcota bacterium]
MDNDLRALALAHYSNLARIGRALANPIRLRLLDLLRQGPRSVETLAEAAGVALTNTSQHLQQLRAARLVESHKEGQRVIYRLADESVSAFFAALRGLAEVRLPEMDRLRGALKTLADDEREELLARIEADEVTLLDVRPSEEFQSGHLPGALCIPLNELRRRLAEIPKGREVVAYCRGPYCPMALEAVNLLASVGFQARHLDLGFPDVAAYRPRGRKAPRPGVSATSVSRRRKAK